MNIGHLENPLEPLVEPPDGLVWGRFLFAPHDCACKSSQLILTALADYGFSTPQSSGSCRSRYVGGYRGRDDRQSRRAWARFTTTSR